MSEEWEEREAKRQAQVDRQLDIYDADVKAKVRAVDQVDLDMSTYPERNRAARHHDVLCLVLKEVVRANCTRKLPSGDGWVHIDANTLVQSAREVADLAYPPPKGEP